MMRKILTMLILGILLLPAMFMVLSPTYDYETRRNLNDGLQYYDLFDSDRSGVSLERPISYSLMDYSPTYYNWFDITQEYTAFPTLGDPMGSGNSTVQPGEIPLVPMDTDIGYDNVLASFSAERNDLATYILYHDSAYIYSVIITHSLYDMTKVYAFESEPADSGILIIDIVDGEGTDEPGLVHVDCRADFHDVVFTTTGNADLFFYRMNVSGDTARYMVFIENVGTENIILIKAGAKVYSGDMSSPYPTPSWFGVFGAQSATVTYDEDYIAGNTTIPAMPSIPTAPTYSGSTRIVNWDGTGDYTTIQSAISASSNGDIVQVMDGTYVETNYLNVNKGIKLIGESKSGTIITSSSSTCVISYEAKNISVENLTLDGEGTTNVIVYAQIYHTAWTKNVIITGDSQSSSAYGTYRLTSNSVNSIDVIENVTFVGNACAYSINVRNPVINQNIYIINTTSDKSLYGHYTNVASGSGIVVIKDSSSAHSIYVTNVDYYFINNSMNITLIQNSVGYVINNDGTIKLENAASLISSDINTSNIALSGTASLTANSVTAGTITMSDTATINANSTIVKTLTVGATATLNTSWLVRPSGTMPGDLTTVQAIHDELVCPAILDGASSIPGGTEYSFTITEMKTLGVYDSDMEVLYHGFPMDITEIADLKSHDQLQTIIYYNGGFMCYEGGEWVITYTVTGADRTAWETRDGFALMGFDANKTGDMIEFYAVYETAGNVPYQFQFKDASTYNVFTQPYYYKLHNTTMSGIGTTVYYHWWSAVSPGNIMIRGYDGTSAYELDRSYATAFYLGSSVVTWFIDSIVPIIDGYYYATDLRLAGQSASLFNVYISQTDIVYQKSGVNVTIPNSHITYRTGELTAYVKNANFTSYTVTASNLTTVTATHGGDIPMGFLTVTESYMFYSHNTFMVFTDEGVLIRAAQLPGVNVAVGEDTALVFEGNYRYLTVTYGDAYLINFGKSMTLIAPNGTVTIYHFTEAFSINTIRVFDDVNASGFYINGVIYLETEFVDGGDLYISTLYDFGYSLYDTSDTEFFDTSYLKLSGNLVSSAVSAFAESEFAALTVVVGQFQSGRIFVTVGDLVLDVRRDGLNYRFTMDGNEIMIRSANQDFIITVVREYEGYTMTVIPARVIGSDYTQIAPERTLQWVDTGSHVASSVAITYSSAEVRIYSIVVRTQSTIQTLPDRILTNQSNIITGDGLTLNVSFWGIGTVLTFGQYTITRTATNVLTVNDTVNNVTTTVPYAHTLSVLWEDAFEVNGRVISANATAPDTVNVNGYLRFSSATETDVTYVTEQVLRVGEEMSFDISQYAVYVLFLSLMSIALIGYFATRAGFGWMEMIEVYGSLIFLIIGCMAVLSGGI